MSYQVRHKVLGIFQGEFLGLAFWYNQESCDNYDLGIEEFNFRSDAVYFVDRLVELTDRGKTPDFVYKKDDFIVEGYDWSLAEEFENRRIRRFENERMNKQDCNLQIL